MAFYNGDGDICRALREGVNPYILKYTAIENLVDTIHSVHQDGPQSSPEIALKLVARVHQFTTSKLA
jgi:DNA-binding NarL/FixJ family response regulator